MVRLNEKRIFSLICYSLTINNILNIIVLLILAGISIVTLTGDNGVLKQATKSKEETIKAQIEEEIKLALMTSKLSKDKYGKIDLDVLEEELKKYGIEINTKGEDGKLPYTVSKSGYVFQIDEHENIKRVNGISLNKTSIKLLKGETEKVEATLAGIEGTITWTSSNTNIVTVDNGIVTALGDSGTATIKASVTSGGINYETTCTVMIVSKLTSISVSNLRVQEGSSAQLQVNTTPSNNVEDLSYESGDTNIVIVNEDGMVTGISSGETTITVKGKKSTNITGTCNIIVKSTVIGSYVDYGVSYTDMYTGYEFSSSNGWRILDPGTKINETTYSGTKLVSTGIPALINHHWNAGGEASLWWDSAGTTNVDAAKGLQNNFEKITFINSSDISTENKGCYLKINQKTSGDLKGNVFKTGKASKVSNLTLEELNEARKLESLEYSTTTRQKDGDIGLFYMQNLEKENSEYKYNGSTAVQYCLATPYNLSSTFGSLWFVNQGGGITADDKVHVFGVRPVITLNSNISKNGEGKWVIQ